VAALVAASPATLDTLNELAAALGNDANFAATLTGLLALKAPLDSPVLTGTPIAPTPNQFDNDASLATTAFVQRALGNCAGIHPVVGATTLPNTVAGKAVLLGGGAGYITILPLVSSVPLGTMIHVASQGSGVMTIARQGADIIYVGSASYTENLITGVGFSTYVASSAGVWTVISGVLPLQLGGTAGIFGASLAASGYQKLPSGLIIQWGSGSGNGSTPNTITFPIAFTIGVFAIAATPASNAANDRTLSTGGVSLTSFQLGIRIAAGGYAADAFGWIAIGY